jgi:hypothetical protein
MLDGDTALRKYTLESRVKKDNPYTAMAIVPPLMSRAGLLEVRLNDLAYKSCVWL